MTKPTLDSQVDFYLLLLAFTGMVNTTAQAANTIENIFLLTTDQSSKLNAAVDLLGKTRVRQTYGYVPPAPLPKKHGYVPLAPLPKKHGGPYRMIRRAEGIKLYVTFIADGPRKNTFDYTTDKSQGTIFSDAETGHRWSDKFSLVGVTELEEC